MTLQKLVILFAGLTGGAIGLFTPVGVVKWLLQTEPGGRRNADRVPDSSLVPAGDFRSFNRPQAGDVATGGKRVSQR